MRSTVDPCEVLLRRPAVIYPRFPRDEDEDPLSPLDQLRAAYPAEEIDQLAALLVQHVRFEAPQREWARALGLHGATAS